ncbi:hypothetical protein ACFQVD_23700 [Streptosporangium amethystogenes subsp. fukuiense]|uniref:Uncharacterized protein n=1 Tax=Streptosporangium amethystogenes subsp. fukuiense TaxID=698418 RepID=A0ABW2T387_9ACTN
MAVRHIPWPVGTALLPAHPVPLGPGGTFAVAPDAERPLSKAGI